jgi:predicted  nucleic acid-binding Zn-ribbon protein
MGALADRLDRQAGQLIRSVDWNDLVAAVEDVETTLEAKIKDVHDELKAAVDAVTADVTALKADVQQLQDDEKALADDFGKFRKAIEPALFRVTMATSKPAYALGEQAEITATVASIDGRPVADGGSAPWVEFVATWGRLAPVGGFTSIGEPGERSMSVQADATGVAKVLLVADHAGILTDDVQTETAATLTTKIAASNLSIGDTILAAATPSDAPVAEAFKAVTQEYDRTDVHSVRSFVDSYYFQKSSDATAVGPEILGGIRDFQGIWRDERTAVLAFARSDDDPTTPDQSRGVGSTVVVFRDWIRPWITLAYLNHDDIVARSGDVRDHLAQQISPDLAGSLTAITTVIPDLLGDGLLRKQRDYQVVEEALGKVTQPADLPYTVTALTGPILDGVAVQRTLDAVQAATPGVGVKGVALGAFSVAASRGDAGVVTVQGQVEALQQQLNDVKQSSDTASGNLRVLQQRVDDTLADQGPIKLVTDRLTAVEAQAATLREIDPTAVKSAIEQIGGLRTAIDVIRGPNQ